MVHPNMHVHSRKHQIRVCCYPERTCTAGVKQSIAEGVVAMNSPKSEGDSPRTRVVRGYNFQGNVLYISHLPS